MSAFLNSVVKISISPNFRASCRNFHFTTGIIKKLNSTNIGNNLKINNI